MPQDRALELLQLGARLDPELVDEHRPRVAIRLERLRLTAGRVERPHQRRARPLAQRVLADEGFELGDELRVTSEREVGVDPQLERAHAELLEPDDLRLGPVRVRKLGERRSAPELECVAKELRRGLGRCSLRLVHQPLEREEIELVRRDADR